MLRRDGAETEVLANFYHAVVQAVLLFGVETWLLSAPMMQRLEGAHVGLMREVTRKKAKRLRDRSWRQVTAKIILQGVGT